jgi:catechol 2,3-dioxygenase
MGTDPLNVRALLNQSDGVRNGLPPETRIGHVHLQVAHLNQAESFYSEVLGFELMQRYGPSAVFLSAGGYHHHVGLNTWAGVGAPPPPAPWLRHFTIHLPDNENWHVTKRLQAADAHLSQSPSRIERAQCSVRDPSGNGIVLDVDRIAE